MSSETQTQNVPEGHFLHESGVLKVKSGWKVCPKCKRAVKGPRTGTCTHDGCGHVFTKKVAAKPTPKKAAKPAKVQEIVKPIEPARLPCPYTQTTTAFLEKTKKNVAPKGVDPWTGYLKANTYHISLKPNNAKKILRGVYDLPPIEDIVIPDAVSAVLV